MLNTFKRDSVDGKRKRLHCADCERSTIHSLEARCVGTWGDDGDPISGGHSYSIFRCGACDSVCYETASWHSEDYDYDEDGNVFNPETTNQYPTPVSAHFSFNTEHTPSQLDLILSEMLYALAGNKMVIATIALRLAIEFIVKDKKCTGNSLLKKIDDLRTKDLIDDDQKELLHRIRTRGNAGAHDAVGMTVNELVAGMSIVEGLLEKLYNGPARHAATISRAKQVIK